MTLNHSVRRLCALALTAAVLTASITVAGGSEPAEAASPATTAWQNGQFAIDRAGVVSRSNIVLGKPNTAPAQSLGLGNGSLGVAAWAANGFTAQLNRTDTMPDRKSPGQVTIPGLSAMTSAANFTGTLDLYNGVLRESGGGMTLKAWVASGKDELIIDVTGANPAVTQTATISLWSGRNPTAAASGTVGTLAETWIDDHEPQWTGATFGSLAAITASGQNVTASVVDSRNVRVSFRPNADGSFRVIVGAPSWKGGNAAQTATALFGADATASQASLLSSQSAWWNGFWAGTGLMKLESADGVAEYMENLRAIYLYTEAASMRGTYPGSQAGSANMFDFGQDHHNWTPSMTWLWNLRTQITANMSSGNFALNTPIFDLYLNALPGIKTWTNAQMGGLPGACVSETMRFNGNGGNPAAGANASCSRPSSPNWNALNITSGAEISFFIWQQYQYTGDVAFLSKYYPLIKESAIFLLAYHSVGADGLLHSNANAHETQWAVNDPTTNIVAMQALFPLAVAAAQRLGTDASLVSQWQAAIPKIPPYARTDQATRTQLLTPNSDAAGNNVIAISYQPTATIRNSENVGLEPVWPWGLIGDTSSLMQLAVRTYNYRPVKDGLDWSLDAIQAARLNLASEVRAKLISITQGHQVYINGMADLGATVGQQSYLEQSAGVATALNEALVQHYDGLLRIAPAWPSGWDVSGTVSVLGKTKVDVQVQAGTLTTVAIEAGSTETLRVRNPWAGQAVRVINGSGGAVVVANTTAATLNVPVTAGQRYLLERVSNPTSSYPFAQVTGTAATAAKHLGSVQIGLDGTVAPGSAPTFYANANFGGSGVTLAAGSYDINRLATLGIANDSVSSIRVPSGFTVVAYGDGDFTGPSWSFTADAANLANSGNDNAISSIVITGSGGGGGGGGSTPSFYQDTAFGGTAVSLGVGSYSTAQLVAAGVPNNWVSSIRVPAGYTVRAYDGDLTGTSWTYTTDQANLVTNGNNDQISSLVITVAGGATPSFYQDTAYGGTAVSLGVGSYSTAQLVAAGVPNNWVSSIRVPAGYTVRAYDGDLTGTSWTYTTDQANLVTNGNNDQISSLVITSG